MGFRGLNDFVYSYSAGIGGLLVNGFPLAGQVLAQQYENSTAFSHINSAIGNFGANGLRILPESNSENELNSFPKKSLSFGILSNRIF